uniref:Uncharacterized protein n=1 Tax=Timema monikensis TaxID=170555 RepID=A0A7R9HJZ0_9NEOP|nr:unnamed protein product [Timema monikensis]
MAPPGLTLPLRLVATILVSRVNRNVPGFHRVRGEGKSFILGVCIVQFSAGFSSHRVSAIMGALIAAQIVVRTKLCIVVHLILGLGLDLSTVDLWFVPFLESVDGAGHGAVSIGWLTFSIPEL